MSLVNDFNQLDTKFDGINLTFFTFFMMFQLTEDKKLIWCGYPIINDNIELNQVADQNQKGFADLF